MGVKRGAKSIGEMMRDAVLKAGKPLSAAQLAAAAGISVAHACSELRRQVMNEAMHVHVLDYCGSHKPKQMFANGRSAPGYVPPVVGAPASRPEPVADEPPPRFSSVWDYARSMK